MEAFKNHMKVVLAILIVLILGVVTETFFYIKTHQKLAATTAKLSNVEAQLQEKIRVEQERIRVEEEKIAQEEAQKKLLKIISPNGGETICSNENFPISWQAPADLETVIITLTTSVSANRLGEFPAVKTVKDNVGYGSVSWNLKNEGGYSIAPGGVYKLWLHSTYKGQTIESRSDKIFSIIDCNG